MGLLKSLGGESGFCREVFLLLFCVLGVGSSPVPDTPDTPDSADDPNSTADAAEDQANALIDQNESAVVATSTTSTKSVQTSTSKPTTQAAVTTSSTPIVAVATTSSTPTTAPETQRIESTPASTATQTPSPTSVKSATLSTDHSSKSPSGPSGSTELKSKATTFVEIKTTGFTAEASDVYITESATPKTIDLQAPTSSGNTNKNSGARDSRNTVGMSVGIGVGVVMVLVAIGAAVYFWLRYRRLNKRRSVSAGDEKTGVDGKWELDGSTVMVGDLKGPAVEEQPPPHYVHAQEYYAPDSKKYNMWGNVKKVLHIAGEKEDSEPSLIRRPTTPVVEVEGSRPSISRKALYNIRKPEASPLSINTAFSAPPLPPPLPSSPHKRPQRVATSGSNELRKSVASKSMKSVRKLQGGIQRNATTATKSSEWTETTVRSSDDWIRNSRSTLASYRYQEETEEAGFV